MDRLKAKVAIVTGAGSRGSGIGNGRAAAVLLAREGAKVFLVDINREAAEETLRMIQEEKREATVHQADLTEESFCQQMVKRCVEVYGRIDILDNNVGIGSSLGGILQTTGEEWDRLFAVNLKTMIFCSKAVIPYMKQQGGGSIINIASYSGIRYSPMVAYGSTKAAMIHLTKIMAVDHGRDNIRVNCIAPGYIDTPLVSSSSPMTPERRKKREEAAPLGRQGTPWEVGWAVVFLASDEASFITGAVLMVDGGRSCRE